MMSSSKIKVIFKMLLMALTLSIPFVRVKYEINSIYTNLSLRDIPLHR